MNGFMSFNELMSNIEREEVNRGLLREWYKERSKSVFVSHPKIKLGRNN